MKKLVSMAASGVLIGIFALCLSGCVFFTHPICLPQWREDIPNFEGVYKLKYYDQGTRQVNEANEEVVAMSPGPGHYRVGNSEVYVCKMDGRYFIEGKQAGKDYYALSGIERRGDGGFNMITYAVDARLLEKHKIPYEVIKNGMTSEKILSEAGIHLSESAAQTEALLVNNSNFEPQFVFQLLDELTFRVAYVRTFSKKQPRTPSVPRK